MNNLKRVAIHSVPRSGSTWLGSIFDSSPCVAYRFQPLFSFAYKGRLSPDSTRVNIDNYFGDILNSTDEFVLQKKARANKTIPTFTKAIPTHVIYKEVRYHHILENLLQRDHELKVIGLIRNPISVIYSWLNAPREFRADLGWKVEEEWYGAPSKNLGAVEEFNGFEKWKEVANLFLALESLYPERFKLVEYGHLIKDVERQVCRIFDFCGLSLEEQTLRYIIGSRVTASADRYGVLHNRRDDDSWVGRLDDRIVEAISKELEGTHLERFLVV